MKKASLIIFISLLIIGIILDLAPIQVPTGIDKIYHFTGFFLITISSIVTFILFFGKKQLNYFFMFILIFGGLFAGISEILQKLTAVRGCDVMDWLVNICGIGVASALAFLMTSKREED